MDDSTTPLTELRQRWLALLEPEVDPARLNTRLSDGLILEALYLASPASAGTPEGFASSELAPYSAEAQPLGVGELDLRSLEQAGASASEELAALALALSEDNPPHRVHLGVGTDVLTQIAKLRAARLLALRIAELTGQARPLQLWAYTSARTFTRFDPWTNMLRNAASVFASVVGGADKVTPLPWDRTLGQSDVDACRLADHTVRMALAESHLAAHGDLSAGAFALESLSNALCEKAWELAGNPAALSELKAKREAEQAKHLATRRTTLLGTNLYPNLDEDLPYRPEASDLGVRLAAPLEALRERFTGKTIFVATWGPLAQHTARSSWVGQLLAVAGLQAIEPSPVAGYASVEALTEAFKASQTTTVVLALADKAWGELATLAHALKAAGAKALFVAGKPNAETEAQANLYSGHLFAGQDIVTALTQLATAGDLA